MAVSYSRFWDTRDLGKINCHDKRKNDTLTGHKGDPFETVSKYIPKLTFPLIKQYIS